MRAADPRPTASALAALSAILALAAGCADDNTITMGRADSGVLTGDGGTVGPLQLQAGMTFTYRGILTRRDQNNAEANSTFELTLTIDSVHDQGATGDSTVTFHATGTNTLLDDWSAPFDFDTWVGRLGPSLGDDRVGTSPVTATLSDVPAIPPAPTPKALPAAGTWFFDVRQIDAVRAAFVDHYALQSPQVTDPSVAGGKWRFAFSGTDDGVVYYPVHHRDVMLTYDPRGFLTELVENVGDTNQKPAAFCNLKLISGP